jgi:cysteine desulfurase
VESLIVMDAEQSSLRPPIYLDGHATTPLAPEAAAAMAPWWHELSANAHSPHAAGQNAAVAVEQARFHVARLIGADPGEIIFTSGATEANALAIIGLAHAARTARDNRHRIVVSAIEHKSVLESAHRLARDGFEIVIAPVTASGVVDLQSLARLVTDDTLLVSVMAANNEVGVVQPIEDVAAIVRAHGALLHIDASQQVGKLPIDLNIADFASISSHKMYGPVGVGALFISAATTLQPEPLFAGGAQERGLRPGTLPVPLIVGFGAAARVARTTLERDIGHARRLAEQMTEGLSSQQVSFIVNGLDERRLPGSLSLRLVGCDAASIIARLSPTVSIAEGSACTSGQITPSHVLTAMGQSAEIASQTVRILCGRYSTENEILAAAEAIGRAVQQETIAHWTGSPVGSVHEGLSARF